MSFKWSFDKCVSVNGLCMSKLLLWATVLSLWIHKCGRWRVGDNAETKVGRSKEENIGRARQPVTAFDWQLFEKQLQGGRDNEDDCEQKDRGKEKNTRRLRELKRNGDNKACENISPHWTGVLTTKANNECSFISCADKWSDHTQQMFLCCLVKLKLCEK